MYQCRLQVCAYVCMFVCMYVCIFVYPELHHTQHECIVFEAAFYATLVTETVLSQFVSFGIQPHDFLGTSNSDEAAAMDQALDFINAFPECAAWHVTALSADKRQCLFNRQSIGRAPLLEALPQWLQLNRCHVFVRPLLSNLVFLDLDDYKGRWEDLLAVRPRCVTSTSAGDAQVHTMIYLCRDD